MSCPDVAVAKNKNVGSQSVKYVDTIKLTDLLFFICHTSDRGVWPQNPRVF